MAKKVNRRGKNNPNWRGGTSLYYNKKLFKQNKLKLIDQTDGRCEICANTFQVIHHMNGKKHDNRITNLMILCQKCHRQIHADQVRNILGST